MNTKKVLLLGDSIRMYYQSEAIRLLGEEYTVWAPEENCRFAKYTLNSLRFWLPAFPEPDIIHWNNGLWDIKRLYDEPDSFTSVSEYLRDLERIWRVLNKTGAKIIFATSTPVKPGMDGFDNDTIQNYNQAAAEMMRQKGIVINDLFSVVYPHTEDYIGEDLLHLSEVGKTACGSAVAKVIRENTR